MQLIKTVGPRADVQFTFDDLLTLNNSLSEICYGIKLINFEAKIGVSREEAKMLLDSVHKLIDELRPPRPSNKNLQESNKSSSSSRTIKEKCILETSGYQVTFFLRSLDYSKRAVGIGVMLTINPDIGRVTVRSTATRMMIPTLQSLGSYLERHINNLKRNPNKTSDLLNYHIFQIQALSGNVTSEDEGSFTLRFIVNAGEQKDKGNTTTYVSAEAVVTFANIRSFTSSLQSVLNELSCSERMSEK